MKQYDVYGIGNALVDTEYEVEDAFLDHVKLPKGIMTLIEEEDRNSTSRGRAWAYSRQTSWRRVSRKHHGHRFPTWQQSFL
jgi:hypothetical protein